MLRDDMWRSLNTRCSSSNPSLALLYHVISPWRRKGKGVSKRMGEIIDVIARPQSDVLICPVSAPGNYQTYFWQEATHLLQTPGFFTSRALSPWNAVQ